MIFQQLRACVAKETRLLTRDLHGLGLLFVMPMIFILVMSLALQDAFSDQGGAKVKVLFVDHDGSRAAAELRERLAKSDAFQLDVISPVADSRAMAVRMQPDRHAIGLEVRRGYGDRVTGAEAWNEPAVVVTVAAQTSKQIETIFVAALRETISRQRATAQIAALGDMLPTQPEVGIPVKAVDLKYEYSDRNRKARPTAVQQSVPAWLVFGMFFIAIPFSNTLIMERQVGTRSRLRTINLSAATQFAGKLLPYFVVNQLQVVVMLAAGVFLVPLVGGTALQLHGQPLALVLLSIALSLAALGVALLVAVIAKTSEQATLTSGLGAILLAAIGGIMVPSFVMPPAMQTLAQASPMAWGLEGFLALLLRNGTTADILPQLLMLGAFGVCAMLAAFLIAKWQA